MISARLFFLIVLVICCSWWNVFAVGRKRNDSSIRKHTSKRFMIPVSQPGSKPNDELTPEAITITKKSNSLKDTELPGAFGSDPELRDSFEGTGSGSGAVETNSKETASSQKEQNGSTDDVKIVTDKHNPSEQTEETESGKQNRDETLAQHDIVAETASNFGNNIPIVPGINPTSAFISNDNPGDGGEGSDYGTRVNHKRKHARKISSLNHDKNIQSVSKQRHHKKSNSSKSNDTNHIYTNQTLSRNIDHENATSANSESPTQYPLSSSSTTATIHAAIQTTADAAKKTHLDQPDNEDDDDVTVNESEDYRIKNKLSASRDEDEEEERDKQDEKLIENIKKKKFRKHEKHEEKKIVKYDGDNTDDDDDDDNRTIVNKTPPTDKLSTTTTTVATTAAEVKNYDNNKTLSTTSRMHWNSTRARPKNAYLTPKSKTHSSGSTDLYNTIQFIQNQIKQVETDAEVARKKVNKTETKKDKKLRNEVNSVMRKIEDDLIKYRQKNLLPKAKSYHYYGANNSKENTTNDSIQAANETKQMSYQANIPFDPYDDSDRKSMKEAYDYYLNLTKKDDKKPNKHFIYSKLRGESSDATSLPSEFMNVSANAYPQGLAGGPEGFECPWPCIWTCHSYCPKECCNNPYRCKPICREFCTPYCTDKCCAPGSRRLPKLKLQFQSIAETGYNIAKLKKEKNEIENKIKVIEKAQEYASQLFGLPATCPLFCNRVCAPGLCKSECCRPLVNTLSTLLDPINKKISDLQESKPIVSDPVSANRNYAEVLPTPEPPHADNVLPVEKASSSLTPHFALEELPLKKVATALQPPTKQISVIDVPYYADKAQIAKTLQLAAPDNGISSPEASSTSVTPQYEPLRKNVPPILSKLRTDEELLRKALESTSSYSAQVSPINPSIIKPNDIPAGVSEVPITQDSATQFQSPPVVQAQESPALSIPPSVSSLSIPPSMQSMEPISHIAPETKAFYSAMYSPTEGSESSLNADYCPPICRTSCIEQCPNECCPNGGRQRSTIG